jgi:hypothetical protein
MAIAMALTLVDCGSQAESSEWAWGKGRDRTSDGKATGKGQCSSTDELAAQNKSSLP